MFLVAEDRGACSKGKFFYLGFCFLDAVASCLPKELNIDPKVTHLWVQNVCFFLGGGEGRSLVW